MTKPDLLFDFGNVLVQWDLHAIYDRFFPDPAAVEAFLAEVSFLEWNSRMDKGLTFAQGIADISRTFPHYAHLFREYDERWLDTVRNAVPGTGAIVQNLKRSGYPLHLLSNCSAEKFPRARELHPVLNLFDEYIISGEVGMIKPDPAIFRHTLTRLGRRAEACIFVDDNASNVESARRLGIRAIQFQSANQLESEFRKIGISV